MKIYLNSVYELDINSLKMLCILLGCCNSHKSSKFIQSEQSFNNAKEKLESINSLETRIDQETLKDVLSIAYQHVEFLKINVCCYLDTLSALMKKNGIAVKDTFARDVELLSRYLDFLSYCICIETSGKYLVNPIFWDKKSKNPKRKLPVALPAWFHRNDINSFLSPQNGFIFRIKEEVKRLIQELENSSSFSESYIKKVPFRLRHLTGRKNHIEEVALDSTNKRLKLCHEQLVYLWEFLIKNRQNVDFEITIIETTDDDIVFYCDLPREVQARYSRIADIGFPHLALPDLTSREPDRNKKNIDKDKSDSANNFRNRPGT